MASGSEFSGSWIRPPSAHLRAAWSVTRRPLFCTLSCARELASSSRPAPPWRSWCRVSRGRG
eukprot:1259569-Pyramimonas_sp.AAC.1